MYFGLNVLSLGYNVTKSFLKVFMLCLILLICVGTANPLELNESSETISYEQNDSVLSQSVVSIADESDNILSVGKGECEVYNNDNSRELLSVADKNNSKSSINENLTDVNENKNVVLAISDSANALKTTLVKKYVYYNGYGVLQNFQLQFKSKCLLVELISNYEKLM